MTTLRRPLALLAALLALCVSTLSAQEHEHADHASPYQGMESRAIKALDAQRVEGLLQGEGLGLALAAELNGWPGPRHVLDMAEELGLGDDQRLAVEQVRENMAAQARQLGARIVELEETLDRRFAHGHITPEVLAELTGEIARLEGELRRTHLEAHLETTALLDASQREAYNRLRGYELEPGR